ncbi:AraC family transcriptional regulator [Paenibacillus aestuarii]|nr:AraC family transcriptional regulator [Paenibacillus aestuarii]
MRPIIAIRPTVRNAHPYRFQGTFHETPRIGYRYALHLFMEGKGAMSVDNQWYQLEKGSLIFVPPGIPHSFVNDDTAPLFSYNVYFNLWNKLAADEKHFSYGSEPFEQQLMTEIALCPELEALPTYTKLQLYPRLLEDLIHVVRLNESLPVYKNEIVNALLYGWLLQWQQLTQAKYRESDFRIRKLIEKAAGSEFIPDYEEWLTASGLQKSQFHSVFKQTTGLSPQQYIVKLKMRKAKVMLLESNRTITEVAEELGFDSIHYFSRQFTAMFGIPPSLYRKRMNSSDL